IGRLPVITSLEPLDEKTLIEILTAPKNALVKQYIKLFQIDDVELEFEEEALREIAQDAIERKTGARGLRSIIENIMLDVMFELPSRDDIEKCIITKESVYSDEIGKKLIYTDGTIEEGKKNVPRESAYRIFTINKKRLIHRYCTPSFLMMKEYIFRYQS